MNIDDLRVEIKKSNNQQSKKSPKRREEKIMQAIIDNIKIMDRTHKNFLLKQRFIPLLIGFGMILFLVLINPLKNIVLNYAGRTSMQGSLSFQTPGTV